MFQSESKLWHNSYGPAQLMFPVIPLLSCLPTAPAQSAPIPSTSPIIDLYQILTTELLRWQAA